MARLRVRWYDLIVNACDGSWDYLDTHESSELRSGSLRVFSLTLRVLISHNMLRGLLRLGNIDIVKLKILGDTLKIQIDLGWPIEVRISFRIRYARK